MPENTKINIRHLSTEEIASFLEHHGEKSFRAKQIYEWLWKKGVHSFSEMTSLSLATRSLFDENFFIRSLKVENVQKSSDKTIKYILSLHDGETVEAVLIPSGKRSTACVSTQAGCPLGCRFCATASLGLKRNLDFEEIFDQVMFIHQQSLEIFNHPLTNIVIMGMGEPLLNYENLMKATDKICSPEGMNMSPQRITVSTAGIPDKIKQLADDDARFNLALSLHTANGTKRNMIMPVNKAYPLGALIDAFKYYHDKTNNRITVEYILFNNFNDSIEDAEDLLKFCKNFPVKINIIEYNTIDSSDYTGSPEEKLIRFKEYLEGKNLVVNIRYSHGKDISAACGQLINKY
jgi:23S rRNA (adenine2503-C2)-methyltransferase